MFETKELSTSDYKNTPIVIELETKIKEAVQESKEISIFTQEDVSSAANYIKAYGQLDKKLDQTRKQFTEPLDDRKKEIMNFFKGLSSLFAEEKSRLEDETKKWLLRQRQIAEEKARKEREEAEQKAIQEAIEKEEKMKSEAIANGQNPEEVKVEIAIIPETVVQAPKLSQKNSAGISTMKISKWKITDFNLIPREYLTTDDSKIGAIRRSAGVDAISNIPGIEFYFEETITRR